MYSDSEIAWSYSGNSELIVNIDGSRVATISTQNADWNGRKPEKIRKPREIEAYSLIYYWLKIRLTFSVLRCRRPRVPRALQADEGRVRPFRE